MKFRTLIVAIVVLFGGTFFGANSFAQKTRDTETEEVRRAKSGGEVFKEIMKAADASIPNKVMDKAKCIAVFPGVLNAAFVVGGQYGKGIVSCRKDLYWSAPAFLKMTGGSFGFQIGGQSTDFVLLFMTKDGLDSLFSNKFTIGTEASVAAGPVGRTAGASTDVALEAQILSYSRTKGLFAGISLKGVSIAPDKTAIKRIYGKDKKAKALIKESSKDAPASVQVFPDTLVEYAK